MKRKIRRKLRNNFLWVITYSAFMLFIISVSAMDSDSWIPTITMFGSLGWLLIFALANEDRW